MTMIRIFKELKKMIFILINLIKRKVFKKKISK